ncbi:MAG: NAD(P)H-hydrate dehydratase [Planctomycetia bacterium]
MPHGPDPTPPPARPLDAHKASVGRVLVVGGSPGMAGAPFLCAWGALRAGAGLVRVATQASVAPTVAGFAPEVMVLALPASPEGALAPEARNALLASSASSDVLVMGPGAGRHEGTRAVLLEVARHSEVALVLDADALFGATAKVRRQRGCTRPVVLTPHEGEAARLLEVPVEQVRADRLAAARRLAERTDATIVLKGPGTLVVPAPDDGGEPWACAHGGPLLATGGTGDVLAGVLGALLATGQDDAALAARRAVAWHARAGDLLAQRLGVDRGVSAREVADALPGALAAWRAAPGRTA